MAIQTPGNPGKTGKTATTAKATPKANPKRATQKVRKAKVADASEASKTGRVTVKKRADTAAISRDTVTGQLDAMGRKAVVGRASMLVDGRSVDYVMVPVKDYEAMTAQLARATNETTGQSEDSADAATHNAALTRIAGGEETWPEALVNRILDGESPVRVFREHRGLTMQQLVERTGLSQSYVSLIDNGQRTVQKVDTLRALATALDVDLEDLV